MHPSGLLFHSRVASTHQGELRDPTDLSSLAGTSTDRHSSEQALALVPRDSDIHPHTPEPLEEDFEEISYDELRLSLCPADPAHFAPVFGEYSQPLCHETIMTGTDLQTTNGLTDGRYSRALAHHLRD